MADKYITLDPEGRATIYDDYGALRAAYDGEMDVWKGIQVDPDEEGTQTAVYVAKRVKGMPTSAPGIYTWDHRGVVCVWNTQEIAEAFKERFRADPSIILTTLTRDEIAAVKRSFPGYTVIEVMPDPEDTRKRAANGRIIKRRLNQ